MFFAAIGTITAIAPGVAVTTLKLVDPAVSSPLASLEFSPVKGSYSRRMIRRIRLDNFTQAQVGILRGETGVIRFRWEVQAYLSQDELSLFEAIAATQDDRYRAFQDGHWLLEDRVLPVFPSKAVTHPKTLLTVPAPEVTANGTRGYGKFKTFIDLPDNYVEAKGWRRGQESFLVQFGLTELPGG